jgi:type I restriction enzyme S subunit
MGNQFSYDRLTRLKTGDFTYPKLMAWEGAFGIVPDICDGCFVSPEFPVFEIRSDRIVGQFLGLFFSIPQVWESVSGESIGTNIRRRRLHPDDFLQAEIPLPSLSEQRRIVARIEEITDRIAEIKKIRIEEEVQVRQMLLGAFERTTRNAPRVAMREVAPLVRRTTEITAGQSYAELGIRSFGKGTFHKPALSAGDVGSKRIFRIEAGDLLFSNVFAWEGAIAVAKSEDAGRFGSHRFMSCVPRPDIATAEFLRFYFLTNEGIELIRAASPGGAGRNRTLGIEALGAIEVPLPAMKQQEWFDEMQYAAGELKSLHEQTAIELASLSSSIVWRTFSGETNK